MNRIQELLDQLKKQNLDGIFFTKRSNVNYISRFTDEAAFTLVCTRGNFIFTDGRFTELAENLCKGFKVVNWTDYDRNIQKALISVCDELNVKKLGFEKTHMIYGFYEKLKKHADEKNINLIPTQRLGEELRFIKDEEEASYIRKACSIADKSLEQLIPDIKVGVSENHLAAKLEYYMKINGAQGPGFETILISGSKTSLPHGKPNDKLIEDGDFLTIDYGAMYKGYTSDTTRTFIVGEPSKKQIEVYNLVKEAQQVGLNSLKDGILATEPDSNIRKVIKEYEKYYYPGIGHGIGLELHEEPFIGNYGTRMIKKGCILTMEPGLYIPGWGGVRIEDSVLIRENDVEILTKFPKELMIIK